MRFVPANCLREGMKLASTLYGKNNEKLLICGAILTDKYIQSINRLKYPGIYIEDDLSKDIDIINIISDSLRIETLNGVKKLFMKAESGSQQILNEKNIISYVESIIDELLRNRGMMVNMIDLKCFDNYTYSHSVNVAILSIIIGISLRLRRSELTNLGIGALMHDIGKVFISKKIINKQDKLTDEEFEEIKTHSMRGYEYLKEKFDFPNISYEAIVDHHEKFDGSGYPKGKKSNDISLFGRIIAISDVYDALTSERPYRKAINPSDSMEYIMAGAGNLFDPEIVEVFIHKIAPFPIGTMVNLSNGYIGLVIENYESFCLRPTIRVIKKGNEEIKPFEISLKDDKSYFNVTIEGLANA